MGGGFALLRVDVPPDGGGNLRRCHTLLNAFTLWQTLNVSSLMFLRFLSSTPPVPLSLREREGVPPHTRPFTFVNGATTPLEGSGTGQGGHLRRYIKSMSDAIPCYKVFAALMLFLDSYPPVPLSTWKGGTHRSGFSSFEGAAATVEDGRNERSRKTRTGFSCFFRLRAKRAGCARGAAAPLCRK